ncbi:phage holin family protein [Humitalea sp. 24SJ18S-53]|uniref:phage holin family protein n=1 Tax=Humitalea sp. 24SJ18S-53 TaxID=3422307 RepID=UPI003D668C93
MRNFLIQAAITAVGVWLATEIVPGVSARGTGTIVLTALVLGLLNATLRPVFVILSLPLTILTFGLFLLVVNAAMLALAAWMLPGLSIGGFWSAVFAGVVISVVSWVIAGALTDKRG